jgi:Tol biopolymer transport system component
LDRATRARLTFNGNSYISEWAPDSRRLAFQVSVPQGIYWKDVGETADATLIAQAGSPSSWSSDGRFLLYVSRGDVRVRAVDAVDGSEVPNPVAASRFREGAAVFSPDGRFIAFVSDESGQEEVYVQSFPDSGAKLIVSSDGGTEPAWSPTGRELFYRQGDAMMAVVVDTEPELHLGERSQLFEHPYQPTLSMVRNYDVSPDRKSVV